MSTNKTKKVKMATKSCPECDQQVREYGFDEISVAHCVPDVINISLRTKMELGGCLPAHV